MAQGTIGQRVSERFKERSRVVHIVAIAGKIFVIVGALAVGIAQALKAPIEQWSTLDTIVILGAIAAGLAGGIVLFLEPDPTGDLNLAHEALLEIKNADTIQTILDLEETSRRASNLYSATMSMRRSFESALRGVDVDDADYLQRLLQLCAQNLRVALAYRQDDQWTICIYTPEARQSDGARYFVCRAHDRAIHCDIAEARPWEESASVVGLAFKQKRAIVISNMDGPNVREILPSADGKTHDRDRYKSIAAVPITVDGSSEPWGVLVCSNSRVGHFDSNRYQGINPLEAVRAIAQMLETLLGIRQALRSRVIAPDDGTRSVSDGSVGG
jgi:hypothetical protein